MRVKFGGNVLRTLLVALLYTLCLSKIVEKCESEMLEGDLLSFEEPELVTKVLSFAENLNCLEFKRLFFQNLSYKKKKAKNKKDGT